MPFAEPHTGRTQVIMGTLVRVSRETRPVKILTRVPYTGTSTGRVGPVAQLSRLARSSRRQLGNSPLSDVADDA